MSVVVVVLHVIVCVFLIAVVLLQRGKGAQVGAVFGGGGGATMFGGRGAGNFLTKLTAGAATVFMITSLTLAYMGLSSGERMFQDDVEESAPAAAQPAPFEEIPQAPAPEAAAPPAEAPPAPQP